MGDGQGCEDFPDPSLCSWVRQANGRMKGWLADASPKDCVVRSVWLSEQSESVALLELLLVWRLGDRHELVTRSKYGEI